MAGYGYTYQSFSTYNTVRDESRGPIIKPSVPFVPNTNSNSEGYVTKKTIVPVASRPYGDDYPARGDDYPTRGDVSPDKVDEFLTKVQNEASHPARFSPVTSSDWRQSPQPTTYNGANSYGDYGINKEGRKPVGGTIRNDNYDVYNGTNGSSDYGNFGSKEGRKPIGSTIRNDNYDGYNGANNGYGGYGNYNNKEGNRPFGSTTRNDNYAGYNGGNGYGDCDNFSSKERHKPTGNPVLNGNYDRHRPAENYGVTKPNKIIPGDFNRPKISTAWTAAPRKGIPLSEPTNDIEKAIELLKEAAKLNDHSNKGRHKANKTALPYGNYDDYQRRHDEPTSLVKEAERIKNIVTGTPQSRSSVLLEPTTPNKDYETIDSRDATRQNGNFNFLSRPRTQPSHVTFVDGREADYRDNIDGRDDTRRYGNTSIIDSREAEKKFKGKRV